jgi:hypothetical protein
VLLTQDHGTEPMERGDRGPGLPPGQEDAEPLAHLLRRPAGESDRQTCLRLDAALADEMGDPVGQGTGLAGTGAGHDEQWTGRMSGGGPLLGIKPVEHAGLTG